MKIKISKPEYLQAAAFVLICEVAGAIGSYFTSSQITVWYKTLNKPPLTPPDWLFAPVWIILYLLMGISAYLIWKKVDHHKNAAEALIFFGVQLFLNVLWSIIFFGQHAIGAGFGAIFTLALAIILTIYKFYPISKNAAYLLVPYLAWVLFASYLNFSLFKLN